MMQLDNDVDSTHHDADRQIVVNTMIQLDDDKQILHILMQTGRFIDKDRLRIRRHFSS